MSWRAHSWIPIWGILCNAWQLISVPSDAEMCALSHQAATSLDQCVGPLPVVAATTADQPQPLQKVAPSSGIKVAPTSAQDLTPGTQAEAEEDTANLVSHARELLTAGSLDRAAAVLEGVLASTSDEPTALLLLAEVYHALAQPERAVAVVERLLKFPLVSSEARSFILNRQGIYLQSANDFEGARKSYDLAVQDGQHNRHALYNHAVLLHYTIFPETASDLSLLLRAVDLYRAALERGPASQPPSTRLFKPQQTHDGRKNPTDKTDWPDPPMGGGRIPFNQRKDAENSAGPTLSNGLTKVDETRELEDVHDDGIGGHVQSVMVSIHLASALSQIGRSWEAVRELERTLQEHFAGGLAGQHNGASRDARDATWLTARKEAAAVWNGISNARLDAGDGPGAVHAGKEALKLASEEPALHHNMGRTYQKVGLLAEAREAWLHALVLDSSLAPTLASLGHLEGAQGNVTRAREFYVSSLSALQSPLASDQNAVSVVSGSGNDILAAMFLVATAVIPVLYDSNAHIDQVRREIEDGLDWLLAEGLRLTPAIVKEPSLTVGSGSLGYYIIYQGFEDLQIRRKLARAYWEFAPSLRYCASFLTTIEEPVNPCKACDDGRCYPAEAEIEGSTPRYRKLVSPDAAGEVIPCASETLTKKSGASGPEGGVQIGHNIADCKRTPWSRVDSEPEVTTTLVGDLDDSESDRGIEEPNMSFQRRLRVGFLSAYFFHHSVGLLTEGVITRLDRRRFETTAIFAHSHPASPSSGRDTFSQQSTGGKERDRVYETIMRKTENVLDLSRNSPAACRHAIASLQLDVLVFTEIGMDLDTYFLSFARLARRSALFWGHAVTSGISGFDALATASNKHSGRRREGTNPVSNPFVAGGIDYFVSSWLFEDRTLGRKAQRKYSERLYLMKGLTTFFNRPLPPESGIVTREALGIPSFKSIAAAALRRQSAARAGQAESDQATSVELSCEALYLVPQTLYKIHPEFDRIVAGVLKADPWGCVIFIRAVEALTTQALARRMSRTLRAARIRPERVLFIRRVSLAEFHGLVEIANVVLDPFPVGGGRSSFEVLATGTPIVMLYNRTSTLQLTYGMYASMALEGPLEATEELNTVTESASLVTYSEEHFVQSAVAIATDTRLNALSRRLILANNHRIFEQDSVVEEWENFLVGIASSPRPPPLERHRLAVDSSNFTRCEARRHSDIDAGDVVVDRPPVARIERSLSVTSHQNCTGCAQSAQPLRNKSCETEDEAESEAPELLYAVVFTVQAVPNGSERLDLLAEVYDGTHPMVVAKKVADTGGLDYIQYRWIGVVLCHGVGRLKRPVVWSNLVQIDDGPRVLLEVRQGDDLHQVARWHCRKHALGPGGLHVLAAKLQHEVPQHTSSGWVSSREEDRACAVSDFATKSATRNESDSRVKSQDRAFSTRSGHGVATPASSDKGNVFDVPGPDFDGDPNGQDHDGDDGCVTLAITTCKRLHGFLGTVEGLENLLGPLLSGYSGADRSYLPENSPSPRVCRVLVVDDWSSADDRLAMISAFPNFTYVFRGEGEKKGHAASMNTILALVKTRYMLYVEDDWWAIRRNSTQHPIWSTHNFLWRAMNVLKNGAECVSQVLINDQSSRKCAWGDTISCPPDKQGLSSGWPRSTALHPRIRVDISDSDCDTDPCGRPSGHRSSLLAKGLKGAEGACSRERLFSATNDSTMLEGAFGASHESTLNGILHGQVDYRLHEFGVLYDSHDFTYWPGFSLNPALWDLKRLRDSYRRRYKKDLGFDPADIRFEQVMSTQLFDAGVVVAHLPDLSFQHVGAGQSAYEANDMRRPWDNHLASSS